jgi:transcriptional regulator with XRE-family HTH domain
MQEMPEPGEVRAGRGVRSQKLTPFGRYLQTDLAGSTYAQVAAQLGISESYVGLLATGRRVPSLRLAKRINLFTGGKIDPLRDWSDR